MNFSPKCASLARTPVLSTKKYSYKIDTLLIVSSGHHSHTHNLETTMRLALRLLFITLFLVIHSAFVLFWVVMGGLFYVQRVYGPSLQFEWPDGADRKSIMEVRSKVSMDTLDDLLLSKTLSEAEAKQLVQMHGAAVIQSVLTREMAQAFLQLHHESKS
jgi:hypothetical protein